MPVMGPNLQKHQEKYQNWLFDTVLTIFRPLICNLEKRTHNILVEEVLSFEIQIG